MKNKLILLDGNSLFNRAYFALPPLMNKKGFYTNAIYGFAMMLNTVLETYEPSHLAIAFDLKAPTFRHKESPEYKATRKGMPDELRMQVEPLKKMVDAFGLKRVEFEGYEADDIIGTLSKYGEDNNFEVMIITGDKDALQLASSKTAVYITKKGITELEKYTDIEVIEKYGLTPKEFIDLKALMGDKSDNIKGVAGIGEKTGIKLLQEYKSIEGIYLNIDEIKGAVKTKLENDKESAFLSKRLATIIRHMPLETNMDELLVKPIEINLLAEMYREYEFSQLLNKLLKNSVTNHNLQLQIELDLETETNITENKKILELITEFEISIFDKITSQNIYLHLEGEKIEGGGFDGNRLFIGIDKNIYILENDKFGLAKNMLENSSNNIIGHNLKQIYKSLKKLDINIKKLDFDIEIAEYLIDANNTNFTLEYINNKYGLAPYESLEDILGKGKNQQQLIFADQKRLTEYGINAVNTVLNCYEVMKIIIETQDLNYVFNEIEMKLIKVLAEMEIEGFLVDQNLLKTLSKEYETSIIDIENRIYEISGEMFNINSPKQLGVILFEKLGLPAYKKTKTGYSTNIEVLESLQDKHEIINYIMEYRQITKLKSTYIDGLTNSINLSTDRIHTTFNQTIASTGRLSSIEPNLQNIPVRTQRGKVLRGVFISKKGYKLIDADYSQIELRILAHLAGDEIMIDAFKNNQDIHTRTASEVFKVAIEDVTSDIRSAAKAVNFGIVYGVSDFGLSNNLGIDIKTAKDYIEKYFDKYVKIKTYLDNEIEEVEKTGYAKTIFGRRRYIPEIKAKNAMVRSFGKRLAMNTPIQGAAADIIKLAMIKVFEYLEENKLDARLLLQVHDELIVEANENIADQLMPEIERIMESVVELSVKMSVEAKIGQSWLETK